MRMYPAPVLTPLHFDAEAYVHLAGGRTAADAPALHRHFQLSSS